MKATQPYFLIQQVNDNRDRVLRGLHSGNNHLVQAGIDSLAVLIGRCLLEFGSHSDPNFYQQGVSALLDAKDAMRKADHTFNYKFSPRVDHTKPSEWVSFDGDIKYPLQVKKSPMPNAGNGLFCEKPIQKGQVIAPLRLRIQNSGDHRLDWIQMKVSTMINHHPIPNLTLVRGEKPVGMEKTHPLGTETTYLVANKDIPAGEELTADYRDIITTEFTAFDNNTVQMMMDNGYSKSLQPLFSKLDQWDRNVLRKMPDSNKKLQSIVRNNPTEFTPSLELVGGSALCLVAAKSSGWLSIASGVVGLGLAAHSVWKTGGK